MTDAEPIRLPAELLPSDSRFGSGPSKVRNEAVAALADAAPTFLGTSHRKNGVKSVVRRVRAGLASLFELPDGYEVLLGLGGTTVFWDAAIFGLIERRSQHLSFGEFSAKFAAAVAGAPHLEAPDIIESPPGTHPALLANPEVDTYAFPHNETSTGVMMEVRRPDGVSAPDGLTLVDATSGAGALRVDASQFDAYYFAPQKSFASDGGLWLACCSPVAIERIERIGASGRWSPPSIDLTIALENSRLDQTYNTPALSTLFLLAHQIDWMLEQGGLEWTASRCDRSAEIVYGWVEAHEHAQPFVAKPDERSHVTATIDFDDAVDANWLASALRANGIVDTESYRKLGRNQLRIAMFPAIEPDDLGILTRAIDYLIERARAQLRQIPTRHGRPIGVRTFATRNGEARMTLGNRFAHRTRLVIAAILTLLGAVWVLGTGGNAVLPWVVLGCGLVIIVARATGVASRRRQFPQR